MKEITTIITVELTAITKCKDEHLEKKINHKPEEVRVLEKALKNACKVDDATVTAIQYFVMDKECSEDGRSEMDKNND